MIECLTQYKLCTQDIPKLEKIREMLQNTSEIKLSEVSQKLKSIHITLAGMYSSHLKYFQAVAEAQEVIDFFHTVKNFDNSVVFLNGELQGYAFGLSLLNNTIAVRQLLEPFINVVKDPKSKDALSLKKFCGTISKQLRQFSTEELDRRLEKIRNVLERLPEIKAWFSRTTGFSLDTILPFVSSLLREGYYRSRLRLNARGEELSLYFVDKALDVDGKQIERELPRANLQDLICGTIFVNQESIAEEKLKELNRFKKVYQLAHEIHTLRLALEESGHPNYQGDDSKLNAVSQMTEEYFEKKVKYLKHCSNLWEQQLEEAYSKHPRLLFLDRK
jgi:hypothetical protein